MAQFIRCGKMGVTVVDDADFFLLNLWRWRMPPDGYVRRDEVHLGKNRTILMHRFIMGALPGEIVDHWDGDPTNNRRANLRKTDSQGNNRNSALRRTSRSGYKGVEYRDRFAPRWYAYIVLDGRKEYLGSFTDPVEAARAYDAAAVENFGEFARLNFPLG